MTRCRQGLWVASVVMAAALVAACDSRSDPQALHDQSGVNAVEAAYEQQRSGVMVEVSGQVGRLLPDDTEGTPHQRFILDLSNGQTLLIAHNLSLAKRVPVLVGDRVTVRGQYEWNPEGGVLHWTHDDPDGDRRGGWIILDGERYR